VIEKLLASLSDELATQSERVTYTSLIPAWRYAAMGSGLTAR
jgi:hypothetical protein